MNITFDNPDQQLTDSAFSECGRVTVTLDLTTMKGEIRREARWVCITVPNDRDALPAAPTRLDVVQLVLRRLHPVMQYIAEQNGVRVNYYEHPLPRRLWAIEYDSNGVACRLSL